MIPNVTIDNSRALAKLDAIGPNVEEALKSVSRDIASMELGRVMAAAVAHFHTTGKQPGLYLAGIHAGTYDKPGPRVGGYVRDDNQLSHLLEYGHKIPAMAILATAGDVLAFLEDVGTVFARHVNHPEVQVKAYPAFVPTIAADADGIRDRLVDAAKEAARKG